MAAEGTPRKIKFNAKYNWFDTGSLAEVDRGGVLINGTALANSKITIHYKGIDPNSTSPIETDNDNYRYNFNHSETIEFK